MISVPQIRKFKERRRETQTFLNKNNKIIFKISPFLLFCNLLKFIFLTKHKLNEISTYAVRNAFYASVCTG